MQAPGEAFPKRTRLRKRWEYTAVQRSARRMHSPHFVLLVAAATAEYPRLGITVSKKVSKSAVVRNRIKRSIRETFRRNQSRFPCANIVAVAKRGASHLETAAIADELLTSIARTRAGDA